MWRTTRAAVRSRSDSRESCFRQQASAAPFRRSTCPGTRRPTKSHALRTSPTPPPSAPSLLYAIFRQACRNTSHAASAPTACPSRHTSTPPYAASTTLTIQRGPSKSASLERKSRPWAASSGGVAFGAVLWLPAWLFVSRRKKARSKRGILFLLILLCGLPMITSCVGKSGSSTPPAGTYQASVVLTGPGLNETITFTIQEP